MLIFFNYVQSQIDINAAIQGLIESNAALQMEVIAHYLCFSLKLQRETVLFTEFFFTTHLHFICI